LIKKAANDRNCGAPVEKVVAYLRRNYAFSQPAIDAAINRGIELGELVRDQWGGKEVLFDEVKYRSEARLFDEICEHQSLDRESGYSHDEAFKKIRRSSPIGLTPEQEAAIYNALHEPTSITTGGPGTGKTTIIKTLAALVASKNISACALAGRAAFRIQEAAGVDADTIHYAFSRRGPIPPIQVLYEPPHKDELPGGR
jgi:exodeoxyribonuclease V alpha subunit